MATSNPDDDSPKSTNEMWATLSDREKNLVGRSLISFRSFDIENFFPSAVRLIYDSNPFRNTSQPVKWNTEMTEAPQAMTDPAQHDTHTSEVERVDVERPDASSTYKTTLPSGEVGLQFNSTTRTAFLKYAADGVKFGTRGTPNPAPEGNSIKYSFGINTEPAPVAPTNTNEGIKRTPALFSQILPVIPPQNAFEGLARKGLFGTSSRNTDRPGTSLPNSENNTGGSAGTTTNNAFGPCSTSGAFGSGGSSQGEIGANRSSAVTANGSGIFGPAKPVRSGLFGTTAPSAGGSLFGQGSAAFSDSTTSTESASHSRFGSSNPRPGEEGADRSKKPVKAGSLLGKTSSNVASTSHDTSLGSSNAVPTTLFPAHDNTCNTKSGGSDEGPKLSVFGTQKRKDKDVEGCKETAKKMRTTDAPLSLPHNGNPVFSGGFGLDWNTGEAKQGGMNTQVSAPSGEASTKALSSIDSTCHQITGPSPEGTHDSVPSKPPSAMTSQTKANTGTTSLFSKAAAGRIEPFSNNDPFIRPSGSEVAGGKLAIVSDENSKSAEQVSSTDFRFGSVTTETAEKIAKTTEDPFHNIQPTFLFDTVEPAIGVPADPKDMPPDSTQDHFVPYREMEISGMQNCFQNIASADKFRNFSPEEIRLADYNRGQRYGSFPNLLKEPEQAPRSQPAKRTLSGKSTRPSNLVFPQDWATIYSWLTK